MTALEKTTCILSIIAAAVHLPLIIYERKKEKDTWIYWLLLFLSGLAIWQFYGFSYFGTKHQPGVHPFVPLFKKAALFLPLIAMLVFLVRNKISPVFQFLKDPEKAHPQLQAILHHPLPHWLARCLSFMYKLIVWVTLGAIAGSFMALMQGFLPLWFIPVFVLGSIALCWLYLVIYFSYQRYHEASLSLSRDARTWPAAPARVDTVQFGGLRVLESRNLMLITLTVFPKLGNPYQTTIRQLLKDEQSEQLVQGQLVTFFENPREKGYGQLGPEKASWVLRSDYESYQATSIYPLRSKTSTWGLLDRQFPAVLRKTNLLLIAALLIFGFLSPYLITGNLDWLRLRIKYFPQRITFQHQGNFNPDVFNKAFDRALRQIGWERLKTVLFYKDFTSLTTEPREHPGYVSTVTIRGNSASSDFMSMSILSNDRLFPAEALRYDVFKKVLADIATERPLKDIFYIAFRQSRRWSTRDQRNASADIHVLFEGDKGSLYYNSQTGARLSR